MTAIATINWNAKVNEALERADAATFALAGLCVSYFGNPGSKTPYGFPEGLEGTGEPQNNVGCA
jgi:hypothetical protein